MATLTSRVNLANSSVQPSGRSRDNPPMRVYVVVNRAPVSASIRL